jgi:hypothetical protein
VGEKIGVVFSFNLFSFLPLKFLYRVARASRIAVEFTGLYNIILLITLAYWAKI